MDKLKEYLEELAAPVAWFDDEVFCVNDYSGGNEDDAYYGGARDGEIGLARELLEKYFKGEPNEHS